MTDVLSAGMEVPDAPKVRGARHWARSCDLGTSQNKVKMNKHIKHVVEWKTTDVLPARMGVPDAPKIGEYWLGLIMWSRYQLKPSAN